MADKTTFVVKATTYTSANSSVNQSDNIFEAQDSAGTVKLAISNIGALKVAGDPANATITIGNESTDVRDITIQVKDINGTNVSSIKQFLIGVCSDSTGLTFGTGGSTGLKDNGAGTLNDVVTKKLFLATCNATGALVLNWTDSGTEAAYIACYWPDGTRTVSAVVQNAGS